MKKQNITSAASAAPEPSRRWDDDACGTAHALELVGERWSLLVLRELMFGPRRFSDIRASLPGLSANVLSQRLETLERHGLVVRSKLPPPASVQVYGLTDWGYEADRLLMVLGEWAARSPDHDPTLPVQLDPAQRAGILTHASVLATHAHVDQSSPIHRGMLVRENILCTPLAPPPPEVDVVPPSSAQRYRRCLHGKKNDRQKARKCRSPRDFDRLERVRHAAKRHLLASGVDVTEPTSRVHVG